MSEARGDYPKISTGHPEAGLAFAKALDLSLAREAKLLADFDRVTAERDAALGREAELREDNSVQLARRESALVCCEELQQRLTAADERADVLEGLLRRWLNRHAMGAGTDSMVIAETIAAVGVPALKPAEAARCANCDRATVEQCDDAGCGFLGAGNGAPE